MAPCDISCNFSIKIWLFNYMVSSMFVPNIKHEASANRTWRALCRRASSISQPRNKQSAAPARNTTLHEAFAQTVLGHPTISIPYRATFQITRDTVLHAPCNLPLIQSKVNKVSMRYELRLRHRKLSNLPTETSNIRTDWCFIVNLWSTQQHLRLHLLTKDALECHIEIQPPTRFQLSAIPLSAKMTKFSQKKQSRFRQAPRQESRNAFRCSTNRKGSAGPFEADSCSALDAEFHSQGAQ